MTDNEGAAADKRGWPDMRALRWPPEGLEVDPEARKADEMVPPVEFSADAAASGAFVAVPVAEAESAAADVANQGALIIAELRSLRRAVELLCGTVKALSDSGRVGGGGGSGPARSISDHQGRQEIQEYFLTHAGRTVYPKEIAEALNLPVLKVAELCETMALRGQISRTLGG